ncbi:MAG: isochorismatase family protein [Pyrinomonadaceae bacterium]
MKKIELLIIDPQIDFCGPGGALYVPGAEADMRRLAKMIGRTKTVLDDIHVTLDSHHSVHIAHPIFWKDSDGAHPAPFTCISRADVENGRWATTQPGMYRRALEYVRALEQQGRYELTIWNPHCLIGSPGHAVYPELFRALAEWEAMRFAFVDYITKGSNIWTEHYSAVQADVPDPADSSTQINTRLIETLQQADTVLIAGEALTHCVANTVRDIGNKFGDDSHVAKMVLLEDATSGIPGFEAHAQSFLSEMIGRGMQVTTTADFAA